MHVVGDSCEHGIVLCRATRHSKTHCSMQIPGGPFSQTKGPPLSPRQPPDAPIRPSPAHKWTCLSKRIWYFFLQSSLDRSGSLACLSLSADGPQPETKPQPKWLEQTVFIIQRNVFLKASFKIILILADSLQLRLSKYPLEIISILNWNLECWLSEKGKMEYPKKRGPL